MANSLANATPQETETKMVDAEKPARQCPECGCDRTKIRDGGRDAH